MSDVWTCFDVECTESLSDELGAWIGSRLSIPVQFTEKGLRFYLEGETAGDDRAEQVGHCLEKFREAFLVEEPLSWRCSVLEGEDWAHRWKEFFKPLKIGSHLIICPTWEECKAVEGEKVIHIDPGRAFGTGHHETTRLCMEWMQDRADGHAGSSGKPLGSLLDVGTGSGILAIAAALLGFEPVVGVDNDPEALEVAQENIQLNGLELKVQTLHAESVELSEVFDIVIANIQASPLMNMAGLLVARLRDGGRLVLSGILGEQKAMVCAVYEAIGMRLLEVRSAGEWCLLTFERVQM